MTRKRLSLGLALSAVLFVTAGFAATKKIQRNDGSRDWNDLSPQNGDLLNRGSGVSSDSSGFHWSGASGSSGSSVILGSPGTPDNWNGGTGNWINGGNWSAGVPGASSDVTIYSGGNDLVTLDTSSTINSLTLGGASNGFTSELTDGGVAQTLAITNGLTVGQNGELYLTGGSTVSAGADSSNAGKIDLENASALRILGNLDNSGTLQTGQSAGGGNMLTITGTLTVAGTNTNTALFSVGGNGDIVNVGTLKLNIFDSVGVGQGATLNLTNQRGGITDVPFYSDLYLFGTFNDVLGGASGLANLNSVEGTVLLWGQNITDTPGSGTLTISNSSNSALAGSASPYTNAGTTLTINGNVNNSGSLWTGFYNYGPYGSVLTITGNLSNQHIVGLGVSGDEFLVDGNLDNAGEVNFQNSNQSFTVGGNMANEQTGSVYFEYTGEKLQVDGNLDNAGEVLFTSFGSGGPVNQVLTVGGNMTNGQTGAVYLNYADEVLQVDGNFDNAGIIDEGYYNNVTVKGMFTNEATGQINLNGPGVVLQALGGLTNYGLINVNNGSSIDPPFLNNGGTINIDSLSKFVVGPGNPAGLGYIQLANGTLGEMISATNYGVINVNGSALLDGTLAILLQGGFNPIAGSTYKFLNFTSGELSGVFANIENDTFNGGTEKWLVDYDNADGYLELIAEQNTPVPEPATLLVLIPGLLGVFYGLRRKVLG